MLDIATGRRRTRAAAASDRLTPPVVDQSRSSASLGDRRSARRYWILLSALGAAAVLLTFGYLTIGNPMPLGSAGYWLIAERRAVSVVVMLIVACCQGLATVAFQTVTTNRIVTPSLMGFEALYLVVQTGAVFFLGAVGVSALAGAPQFAMQVGLMVGFALLLYSWLLSGRFANLEVMLLVGIVIGGGLGSISTFMQRLLTPSEFDVLTAKLFGSISNADPRYLPIAIPLVAITGTVLVARSRRLNLMAMGCPTAISLGLNHRRELIITLTLVAVLMATSTALVGPMTFLGFLVAMLAYQFAGTFDHRYVFPVAVLVGFVILVGSYLVMKNIFYAQGVVSILIESVGGITFLAVILKKGRL